jgi:hypothetical protein
VASLGFLLQEWSSGWDIATQNGQYGCLEVMHRAWLGHWSGGLAACSGEMVAAHWVEVVAIEVSASGSSNVGLENLAAASETESGALVLALAAGSSGVA